MCDRVIGRTHDRKRPRHTQKNPCKPGAIHTWDTTRRPRGLTRAFRVLTLRTVARRVLSRAKIRERWLMSTVKVTDANFKSEVMGAGGPVVVDF